jgi:hypothetical protein
MKSTHIGDFSRWENTAHFRRNFEVLAQSLRRN